MKASETRLTYDLTYKDVVDILKIIDDSACKELHLELGDLKLDIVKGRTEGPATARAIPPASAPVAVESPGASAPEEAPAKPAAADVSGIPIHTPLSGTFYRAPAPGAKPFVEVGSSVKAGDQVAIVEVMKLMNSIKAPRDGIIREILVENEAGVEMGQMLMTMDPPPSKGTAKRAASRKKK